MMSVSSICLFIQIIAIPIFRHIIFFAGKCYFLLSQGDLLKLFQYRIFLRCSALLGLMMELMFLCSRAEIVSPVNIQGSSQSCGKSPLAIYFENCLFHSLKPLAWVVEYQLHSPGMLISSITYQSKAMTLTVGGSFFFFFFVMTVNVGGSHLSAVSFYLFLEFFFSLFLFLEKVYIDISFKSKVIS